MRPDHELRLAFALSMAIASSWAAPVSAGKAVNPPPTASITSPANGSSFATGANIVISANASDSNGSVSKVQFYRGQTLVGTDSTAPYSVSWSNAAAGSYSLKAVATDNGRAMGSSALVNITVATPVCASLPSVPTGLSSPSQTATSASLSWAASVPGNNCTVQYHVYRDGVDIASVAGTSFTVNTLAADTAYSFSVSASNQFGNSAQGTPVSVRTSVATAAGGRVVAYFAQWGVYERNYRVRNIQASGSADKITHINYAFGNVRNNRCEVGVTLATNASTGAGGDAYADYANTHSAAQSVDGVADIWNQPLRGNWNQLKKLKATHPNLKVLISLGGWTWSRGFATAAQPANRSAFVASCIDAYIRGNLPTYDNAGGAGAAAGVFDGIDIDWEYPAACGLSCGSSADSDNFTALLAEFRSQLDAVRPGLLLTIAASAGIDKIRVTRPDLYHPSLDFINLMSYDFHGSWDAKSNHHSALYDSINDPSTGDARLANTNDAVEAFLTRGVPAAKLNIGIGAFGHGWTNVANVNNGLYQNGIVAPGTYEAGMEDYRVLKTLGYPAFDDPIAHAHWIYNGTTFWSFDDPATVADKMAYAKVQGIGGAMMWELSGDDATGSLLDAISTGLE